MDKERQTEMESQRLMNLLHYQLGFALCGTLCLWAFIPPCASFPLSELIMRELYWPRQTGVSLSHTMPKIEDIMRGEKEASFALCQWTQGVIWCVYERLCFHYLCILGWYSSFKRTSFGNWWGTLFFFKHIRCWPVGCSLYLRCGYHSVYNRATC